MPHCACGVHLNLLFCDIPVPLLHQNQVPSLNAERENTCRKTYGQCLLPVLGLAEGEPGEGGGGGEEEGGEQASCVPGQASHLQDHCAWRVGGGQDLPLF